MSLPKQWVHRVGAIMERTEAFVDVLKEAGAGAEELAVALVAIVSDLEREANTARRHRR